MNKFLTITLALSLISALFIGCNSTIESGEPLPDTAPTLSLGISDSSTPESAFDSGIYSIQPDTPANIIVSDNLKAKIKTEYKEALINETYTAETDSYDINFNYFLLDQDAENSEIINQKITDYVSSFVEELTPKATDGNNLLVDISSVVNLYNDDCLSLSFSGYVKFLKAEYPQNIFKTLNIDTKTGEIINVYKELTVDSNFVSELMKYPIADKYSAGLIELTIDFISKNPDIAPTPMENSSEVYYYLKENTIGVSLSLPHSLGDHMEFELPIN